MLCHCHNPLCLHPAPYQDKVGIVSNSKATGVGNPPTKEPPMGTTEVQQESIHKWKKRTTLEHADKEIKETTPLSPTELLP